jgi:exosortase K
MPSTRQPPSVNRPIERRFSRYDAGVCVLALLMAYVLKRHYSTATADELAWILRPTASVVAVLTGTDFVAEANTGFVSKNLFYIIAPSCAGLNFLIIVLCMSIFALSREVASAGKKALVFVGCAATAYLFTVLVNAVRILIAIKLHMAGILPEGLTAEQFHRIEGIAVYFSFLCLFFFSLQRLVIRRRHVSRCNPYY